MACSQQLAAQGKPSPRTCQDCGLGPCRHPSSTAAKNGIPKITREELEALFGPSIPASVVSTICWTDKSLIEIRKEVYRAALHAEPKES